MKGTAGTIGAIVYDRSTGQPYALSNWHILHGPQTDIGDRQVQPGRHDNNRDLPENDIGVLIRSHLGVAADCAICSIINREIDPRIYELGIIPRRIAEVELEDRVVKSGRTLEKWRSSDAL